MSLLLPAPYSLLPTPCSLFPIPRSAVPCSLYYMTNDFDAIIIGSGAGGGTVALALAKAGKQVLLVERGNRFTDSEPYQDEQRMLIDMAAFDDRTIEVNGRNTRVFIGGILGGGTSLYGAVLMRPSRHDFHPGKYYSEWLPRHLWDWPITYDQLSPYFDQAESLFHVAGDDPNKILHLETPAHSYPAKTPPLEPINQKLERAIEKAGFTPFHLPLGIDFNRCLRCPKCPGYYCPNDSRASTLVCAIDGAVSNYHLQVKTNTEADCLVTNGKGKVLGVKLRWRDTGKIETLKAKTYIIAAGAIGSPVILIKSGLTGRSGQVGRNYMYHCGALGAGLFSKPTGGADTFIKQLGFTDLYFGSEDFPHKLGYSQTLPIPGHLSIQENLPVPIPDAIAKFLLKRMLAMTGFVEDLPQPENRVEVSNTGAIHLVHKFHPYDIYRSRYYMGQLKKVMGHAGVVFMFGATGDKDDRHTAHQVGTTRFGTDPKTSVLDPYCRLHDHDNVFVVDGGFMPTSLGVSPALTIVANALRVADYIKETC
ncbi:GMC family oxidoreductase [Moorena sp. SIOASIH]|uniref:GMC family oxidoreductase N-terminal domain-containing protein n=1 Tax=Moorena sp. SIOASIH TaxID=2607817 RepID=UPI0025E41941|nr:GMC family oxidoreductase [Moorena sp. SIOASIH]